MEAPSASSKWGAVQPPSVKPPVGSSCGPPGACMTPSRLVKVATTILRMVVSCGGGLYPEDERRRAMPTGRGRFFRTACLAYKLALTNELVIANVFPMMQSPVDAVMRTLADPTR